MISSYRFLLVSFLSACLVCCAGGCARKGPTNLAYWEDIRSPEGWKGRRYAENDKVVAEEFDAVGNDGAMDFWRFYQDGKLFSEEHDRDSDGSIDFVAEHDPKTGAIISLVRDTDFDGRTDLWVDFDGTDQWTQTRDRNGDGVLDLLFVFRGGKGILAKPSFDLYETSDFSKHIPKPLWVEQARDENLDGRFDAWLRYAEGRVVARGAGQGRDGRPAMWLPEQLSPAEAAAVAKGKTYTRINRVEPGTAKAFREQQQAVRETARVEKSAEPLQTAPSRSVAVQADPQSVATNTAPTPRVTARVSDTRSGDADVPFVDEDVRSGENSKKEKRGFFARLRSAFRQRGAREEDADEDAAQFVSDAPETAYGSSGDVSSTPTESGSLPNLITVPERDSAPSDSLRPASPDSALQARPKARVVFSVGEPAPLPDPDDLKPAHPSAGLER